MPVPKGCCQNLACDRNALDQAWGCQGGGRKDRQGTGRAPGGSDHREHPAGLVMSSEHIEVPV